jgi:hypothetical protein
MEWAKLGIDFLRVILSSQIVYGLVAITFFVFFKDDIKALIKRIAKIRFPGGSELSTSQLEKASEVSPGKGEPPTPVGEAPIPQNISLTPQDIETISQLFNAERAKSALWEYRYLNYFLARHTQQFLDWLSNLPNSTTVPFADAFWMPAVPDPNERKAVLNALLTHHLVQLNGELIEVTPKGKEYIQWRGPLPSLAG